MGTSNEARSAVAHDDQRPPRFQAYKMSCVILVSLFRNFHQLAVPI
jgi:hypothetical protein